MCTCTQENCDLEVFESRDKCILHCEKDDWKLDSKKNQYFSNCLKNLISEYKKTDNYKNKYLLELKGLVYPLHNFGHFEEVEVHFGDSKFINDVVLSSKDTKFIQFFNCDFYSNFRILGNLGTFDKELIIRECIFHNVENPNIIFNLSNTNFEKYVDLRETKFYGRIEFDDSSFEDNVFFNNCYFSDKLNFFNIELYSGVTNRETARIIKDSFEQQNNIIEANKFYALEMEKRKDELEEDLKEGKNFFEWFVFKIHGLSSNHSQDWLLALYWIFIIAFIASYYDFNLIQDNSKFVHFDIISIFKIIIAYLIYQLIISIRQNTRRK
jgi:hypothetical protein